MLQEELDLPALPQRIECYDISNIQGTNSVGSMVVFIDGHPRPQEYRRFRIKTVEGANDFASMAEVLRRRFSRAREQLLRDTGASAPDVPTRRWRRPPRDRDGRAATTIVRRAAGPRDHRRRQGPALAPSSTSCARWA